MTQHQLFRKTEERTFFAHHMLLHVAELEIAEAESSELGRFNKCLTAMVMSALAVEALANAVGSRIANDWATFESLRPHEKLELLVTKLAIPHDPTAEPWTTLQYLGRFRNDIAHPKPDDVTKVRVLPNAGLSKTTFDAPLSKLEREISLGNAKRSFAAVRALKGLLTDAMPESERFGIYADMWHGSTEPHHDEA
jgi:hypothetical protein